MTGHFLPSNVPTQIKQLLDDSNHGPVSKDLLFSNWLLMCLAGNYCDSDKGFAFPGGVSSRDILTIYR